jgi:hypothetical protein
MQARKTRPRFSGLHFFTSAGGLAIAQVEIIRRLVITQTFCVPRKAILSRGATVELRPAF